MCKKQKVMKTLKRHIAVIIRSLACLHGQELLVQSNNASDLKQYEQLTQTAVLNDTGAGDMNTAFNSKKDKYAKLPQDNNGSIWKMYINKGYLVFFSDKGHIEVGFPDNKHYEDRRDRHANDTRYPDSHYTNQSEKTNLTIGAGSNVGYKLALKWATTTDDEGKAKVQAFIYLEYLKFDN
jgi:hypothetical protein